MKKRIATLVFLAAAAAAQAEVIGVMADSATGAIYPASVESRVSPQVLELDMAPGDSVTVNGLVQSVYSDAEQNQEENIRFDANFPASRLTWEDWKGPITQITTDPDDGYSGTFDAAIPSQVTNGCSFFVEEESPPAAHFISAIGENNSATFSPGLQSNATYTVSAIRSAVCDAFGLHAGAATGGPGPFTELITSVAGDWPALATSDGITVFKTSSGHKLFRSTDSGASWMELPNSPTSKTTGTDCRSAIATHDGRCVFFAISEGPMYRSLDGGDSWEVLINAPQGACPCVATSDGNTVFFVASWKGLWRSDNGGETWREINLSIPNTRPWVAVTRDGATLFLSGEDNGLFCSHDGGQSLTQLSTTDFPAGYTPCIVAIDRLTILCANWGQGAWISRDAGANWTKIVSDNAAVPQVCSADGLTIYFAAANTKVRKSIPAFATSATSPYTVLIDAVPRNAEQLKDFYGVTMGEFRQYWTLRTGEDRFSVFDSRTSPIGWYDVAWKTNETWYIRDTNAPAATAATSAPEAISLAIDANSQNRATAVQYSPLNSYDAFQGGQHVVFGLTFIPTNTDTNAPGVSGMGVLYSAFGDTPHWDTDAFRIDIVSTNPTVSKVTWAGDVATHATIRYIPEE